MLYHMYVLPFSHRARAESAEKMVHVLRQQLAALERDRLDVIQRNVKLTSALQEVRLDNERLTSRLRLASTRQEEALLAPSLEAGRAAEASSLLSALPCFFQSAFENATRITEFLKRLHDVDTPHAIS